MRQVTLRLDDDLADALKREAAARETSVNALAADALRREVSGADSDDPVERARAKLRAAGLLYDPGPPPPGLVRPSEEALARARRSLGQGKPLSDYVSEGRR